MLRSVSGISGSLSVSYAVSHGRSRPSADVPSPVPSGNRPPNGNSPITGAQASPIKGEAVTTLQGTKGEGEKTKKFGELTVAEEKQLQELRKRDREVRQHEQAHAAVGGQYAGPPSYDYERGPDGKLYAVGGKVQIDISPVKGDPEATIRKMQVVIRAALAPADPSPQDRSIATQAARQMAQARIEVSKQRFKETRGEEASGFSEAGLSGIYPTQVAAYQQLEDRTVGLRLTV